MPVLVFMAVIICMVIYGVVVCVIRSVNGGYTPKEYKKLNKAQELIGTHAKELAIRRKQLCIKENYGVTNDSKWENEKFSFVHKIIVPAVGDMGFRTKLSNQVYAEIEAAASGTPVDIQYNSELSPLEYEMFVASILECRGWSARITKASGDQGVDIVAEKGQASIAIQCKLYSRRVGNAAVQEIIAGRSFEKTKYAAVVSNNSFTLQAKQLAASSDVLLLHHDQLEDIESIISV